MIQAPGPRTAAAGPSPDRAAAPLLSSAAPLLLLLLWIAVAASLAAKRLPWSNEAWCANPALTLLAHGYPGTTVLEARGTWLAGLDRHLYWMMPLHSLAQAAWYKLFGFSLLRQRLLSVAFGALALCAWYRIALRLSGRPLAAVLALAAVGFERNFLNAAANGRMDMMAASLGAGSLAVFLELRRRRWLLAWLLANLLAAAAVWTHPCGALFVLCLGALLTFDPPPRRLLARAAWLGILPYLAAAALWAVYIAQAPADFLRQFSGNVSGFASEYAGRTRLSFFRHPLDSLWAEWYDRYYTTFFLDAPARLAHLDRWPWIGSGLVAIALALLSPRLRRAPGAARLALLALFVFLAMGIFEGMKFENYLVDSLPFFAAVIAVVGASLWSAGRSARLASVALLAGCAPQLAEVAHSLAADQVHSTFLPAAAYLQSRLAPPGRVIAPAEFAYVFGFEGPVTDDVRLGYFTGLKPAFIVTNDWYRAWQQRASLRDPALALHIRNLFAREYRPAADFGPFRVYSRIAAPASSGR